MSVAFLVTSPYQLFHYKRIAQHLSDVVVVLEARDTDFGLTDTLARHHIPQARVEYVSGSRLTDLDGRYDAIVCQTPILPLEFLSRSLIIAQQYSMAKEAYQYGVWRAHAHLNLMYGEYSAERVGGFSKAVAVGNPLLDPYFVEDQSRQTAISSDGDRLLYMPTYGDLSSLPTVLPHLQRLDVQVTIKLHHAADRSSLSDMPDHVNVVQSDVDPVDLFRSHDVVLSDFSGAAYDALYAGVPLILTGEADATRSDYRRLSADEADQRSITRVAASWLPGADLGRSIDEAQELVGSPLRKELVESYFANPGTAGLACAERITELIEKGEAPSFSTMQVRGATKRYILANRELRGRSLGTPRTRSRLLDSRRLRRAYRRARRTLARSQALRAVYRSFSTKQPPTARPVGPRTPPRDQRESVSQLLAPFFEAGGIRVARIDDAPGATIAFTVDRLGAFRAALRSAGAKNPDLEVRALRDRRTTYSGPASSTPEIDVVEAHAFRIGKRVEGTALPPHGLDGYLWVLPVRFDVNRKRYITLDVRAEQVDWTDAFGQLGEQQGKMTPTLLQRRSGPAPIDVVYTWVDSSDPDWRQQHARYSERYDPHHKSANNDERYANRDELRHSLRSLWTFAAPFVRHIYLVTMDQRPMWLADHPDISVISHKEIFPDPSVLPTFNSHAIEACIHRIDGLSENFLYFNDDVFLGRETTENDYYTKAGLAKVRLAPTQFVYRGKPEPSAIPTDWAAYNASELLGRDLGIDIQNKVMHTPLALKKSVIYEIEERYSDTVARTRAARFRSQTDIAIPSMFAQYYAIGTGRATEWPAGLQDYQYVDTGRATSRVRYDRIRSRSPKFFCVNVTRYDEISLGEQASLLAEFLGELYPEPAPWELG